MPTRRQRWITARLVACALLATALGCGRSAPPATGPAGASGQRAAPQAPADAIAPARPVTATDVDPTAMDEALRQALRDLRNKFKCNSISGCPAHAVLVGFGHRARRPLEAMFPTAPAQAAYRSRIVRIVAELQDPAARPFLRERLIDGSDKARGYAVFGLALLRDRRDAELLHNYANAPGIIASAMTRASAAWGLALWKEPDGEARFLAVLREAAGHQLGGATLRWALELCRVPGGPRCEGVLPVAAQHPSYVVRREVLRAVGERPTKVHARALVILAADPNPNLARRARRRLRALSGRVDVQDAAGWRRWCDEGGCPAAR